MTSRRPTRDDLTIRIEVDLVKQARQGRINLSRLFENTLRSHLADREARAGRIADAIEGRRP